MKIGKADRASGGEPRQAEQPIKFGISREARSSLVADRVNLFAFLVCLFFIAIQVVVVAIYFGNLPPEIPIFYSRTWGESMLGQKYLIWILPSIAAFISLVNLTVNFIFFRNNKFLSRVLFASNIIIGFTTFWGAIKIATLLS